MTSNSEGPGEFFAGAVNHFTSSGRDSVEYARVPGQLHRTQIFATTRLWFTETVRFADALARPIREQAALGTKRRPL
jgi:hypothetical protein